MSAEKLAFLQNFYTDVTLYVPAEAAAPTPPVAPVAAPVNAASSPPSRPEPTNPLDKPAARPGLPKSIPTASQVQLAGRLAGAALPEPAPVAAPLAPANVPPVMLTPFTTLGDNAQGVVLLFRLPQEQFVKLHRNVFLNKMLQALNMVMADVVLVNVESDLPVALANLRRELAATHIIAFGKNLLDTTIRNTQIYEPVLFPSLNLAYLASATVDLVEYDVSLKKRLWPGLQRMFA
ncbi:hypothetical protein JAO73_09020 [Hymenobacter sp. BT523]|uniref:hypothetical protein n=1 Tax=Hymenobacter sp. BT523 TaxID=2795725 RepID=UPI0018EDDCD1|nr:hypothetical protein [Hymenobacter sp. BT523]MBJ6109150.1 hypothetical protein [Hymenobacter sp. BT523]